MEKTNSLHDGKFVGVEYVKNNEDNTEYSEIKIRVLVTSICDTVIEMTFQNIVEWQISSGSWVIFDCLIHFYDNGTVIWTDGFSASKRHLGDCSYVIAEKMSWKMIYDGMADLTNHQ